MRRGVPEGYEPDHDVSHCDECARYRSDECPTCPQFVDPRDLPSDAALAITHAQLVILLAAGAQ